MKTSQKIQRRKRLVALHGASRALFHSMLHVTNTCLFAFLMLLAPARPAAASTAYGTLNNFDVVNDTGSRCHGFEIEIEDAPVGSYAILVGNTQVGTISVTTTLRGTHGEIEFEDDDDADHLPLSFNPLGQTITLRRDGVDYFQRVFPTTN